VGAHPIAARNPSVLNSVTPRKQFGEAGSITDKSACSRQFGQAVTWPCHALSAEVIAGRCLAARQRGAMSEDLRAKALSPDRLAKLVVEGLDGYENEPALGSPVGIFSFLGQMGPKKARFRTNDGHASTEPA
jgi:hypothetical protein